MHHPKLSALSEDWLVEATIGQLQETMSSGTVTSKELVLMYMHRIAAYDKVINSVLEINPEALHIAEALDYERKTKGARGPLHGIPILLKDNIDTGDNMHTSAGSIALAENVAAKDAFIVEKLRQAGAVILGKTNMTEWANFMTENMPNGYSSRGGQVNNPYGPFDVGGSSSGSGAAIAANFAAAAIGTETSGSIISPSSSNSLVGIKPTVGLVSRSGIIPISHSQDTAGPMTRTVKDAAIVLSAISARDEGDAATWTNPHEHLDYTTFLQSDRLDGAVIGVWRKTFQYVDSDQAEVIERAISILKERGATIVDPIHVPCENDEFDYSTLIYEFKPDLNAYLRQTGSSVPVRSLQDVIAFNEQHTQSALKYGQTLLIQSENTSGTLTEAEYINNREKDIYMSQQNGIDLVMEEYKLDAILSPHWSGAYLGAKAGYPSITVPAGYTHKGEPIGITLTAGTYEEGRLISFAYAFEQAANARKAPEWK